MSVTRQPRHGKIRFVWHSQAFLVYGQHQQIAKLGSIVPGLQFIAFAPRYKYGQTEPLQLRSYLSQ